MIDFRSDILGPVPVESLAAMAEARDRQPGFLRHEDAEQERLEREVSEALGFEAALFVPTGTMANQIALRIWCRPGEALLADRESHVAVQELASTSEINSAALALVSGERGHLSPGEVSEELARKSGDHRLRLVWLENTHNRAGGTVMPAGWMREIVQACGQAGVPVHVDGARLWHAAVAAGQPIADVAAGAASLTVSLNKCVGAPAGAMLLGSTATIEEAARIQGLFGGLWRPIAMLAAAARAALATSRTRIELTHERAREFALLLSARLGSSIDVPVPETNIVMLGLASEVAVGRLLSRLRGLDIRALSYGRSRIRFVIHSGITRSDLQITAERISEEFSNGRGLCENDGP
jgi:threonine aldolase